MIEDDVRMLAAGVAGNSELADIRLVSSEISTPGFPDSDRALQYEFESTPEAHYDDDADGFVIAVNYDLSVSQGSEEGSAEADEAIASVKFSFAALYRKVPTDTFTDAALQAFASTTGSFALYPYARQYVQDVTGRIGLPPLTLGLYKFAIERPED